MFALHRRLTAYNQSQFRKHNTTHHKTFRPPDCLSAVAILLKSMRGQFILNDIDFRNVRHSNVDSILCTPSHRDQRPATIFSRQPPNKNHLFFKSFCVLVCPVLYWPRPLHLFQPHNLNLAFSKLPAYYRFSVSYRPNVFIYFSSCPLNW